jgi:hypothetical protein
MSDSLDTPVEITFEQKIHDAVAYTTKTGRNRILGLKMENAKGDVIHIAYTTIIEERETVIRVVDMGQYIHTGWFPLATFFRYMDKYGFVEYKEQA